MTAHHSILVFNVLDVTSYPEWDEDISINNYAPEVVKEIYDVLDFTSNNNIIESLHDAVHLKDEAQNQFLLGLLSLEDRAMTERIFWGICRKIEVLSTRLKYLPDELKPLKKYLADKYFCNFSIFQSVPDSWAIDHVFPIVPLQRLHEEPTRTVTLQDITCDSDGVVDRFVDIRHTKESLELHAVRENEPYYLGFLLIGAYQETLGDLHNLFGVVTEASVTVDANGEAVTEESAYGDSVRKVLECSDYDTEHLQKVIAKELSLRKARGVISENDERAMLDTFTQVLADYTYLA